MKTGDEAIKEHLTAVAGFTPADGWAHVVHRLRLGDWYYVKQEDLSRPGVKVLLKLVPREMEPQK